MAARIIVVDGALLFPQARASFRFLATREAVSSRLLFFLPFYALAPERRKDEEWHRESLRDFGCVCVCVCANAIPAESLQRGAPRPEAEALSSVEGYRNQAAEQQKRNGIRRTRLRFDERKLCTELLNNGGKKRLRIVLRDHETIN